MQAVRADNQRLQTELRNLEVNREELNQELVELRSQLEQERADRHEIQAELSELKQNFPSAATLFDKSTLDTAIILNEIRTRRKKLKINSQDLQVILEILESSAKKIQEER